MNFPNNLTTKEIELQAFYNEPTPFLNICQIKPFTLGEIIKVGLNFYNRVLTILTLNIEELELKEIPKDFSMLEYLLESANEDEKFYLELLDALEFFIKDKIYILSDRIVVGDPRDKKIIDKSNFGIFQNILRIQNARLEVQEDIPENESETAKKFRLLREKREAVKRKQEQKTAKKQKLLSLIQVGEVYKIDTKNLTLCAFYGLIDRHSKNIKYTQDYLAMIHGCQDIKLEDWRE